MIMSMADLIRAEARLIALRALAEEANFSLSETLLVAVLEAFGISKSREWMREEMTRLDEIGAVTLRHAGSVMIATLTNKGRDHVERRLVIEGVKRPSPA